MHQCDNNRHLNLQQKSYFKLRTNRCMQASNQVM